MRADRLDALTRILERERSSLTRLDGTSLEARDLCRAIRIDGSPIFREKVTECLLDIASTRTGMRLLRGLEETGRRVIIRPSLDGKNHARPVHREDAIEEDGMPGPGTSAIVFFNPDERGYGSGTQRWEHRPPYVGLFHELVHAWDYTHGELVPGRTNGTKNCELAAVGLPFDDPGDLFEGLVRRSDGITENDLRKEVGLPRRAAYGASSHARKRSDAVDRFLNEYLSDAYEGL